jgi:hypothetical protein
MRLDDLGRAEMAKAMQIHMQSRDIFRHSRESGAIYRFFVIVRCRA